MILTTDDEMTTSPLYILLDFMMIFFSKCLLRHVVYTIMTVFDHDDR